MQDVVSEEWRCEAQPTSVEIGSTGNSLPHALMRYVLRTCSGFFVFCVTSSGELLLADRG